MNILSAEDFYPLPKERIENPVSTVYGLGDVVEILIGPAKGRLGQVVIDRNGNYCDSEPYATAESIGVEITERRQVCLGLQRLISQILDPESMSHTVVRWFDSADQLELVKKSCAR